MKVLVTMAACIALAGCAAVPQRYEVPVQVPCRVTVPEKPVWATESLKPDADIFDKVKALLAERRQRQAYETKLEAAAKACQ